LLRAIPRILGIIPLNHVDIVGVTGSIPVAPTINFKMLSRPIHQPRGSGKRMGSDGLDFARSDPPSHPHKPSRARERPTPIPPSIGDRPTHDVAQVSKAASRGPAPISGSLGVARMDLGPGFPPPGHMGPRGASGSLVSKKRRLFKGF